MAPIVTSLATLINQFGLAAVTSAAGGGGITATGGVISDYSVSGTNYRAHIFTSTGTFNVTAVTGTGLVEYLVVAGGGSGGYEGGGGAGGLRTNLSGHPLSSGNPSFSVSTTGGNGSGGYTVTIGAGGAGGISGTPLSPNSGTDSYFGPPSTPNGITATGGGGAGNYSATPGRNGGSGGGAASTPAPGFGYGRNPSTPAGAGGPFAWTEGNPGNTANNSPPYWGGGGGGAGGAGGPQGNGGVGSQVLIAGPTSTTGVGALNPGPGQYQWFAGGGGGGTFPTGSYPGGIGGGGIGGYNTESTSGTFATGGGGGGTWSGGYLTGSGGSGIVVVRYVLAASTGTAKATGGAISFFGGKTIHTFTSSGTFIAPSSISSVEYVVIGGGGGGGGSPVTPSGRGGGGAGGYRSATGYTIPSGTYSIQVGAGAANANSPNGTPSKFYQGGSTLIEGTGGGSGGGNPGGSGGGVGAGSGGSTVSSPDGISPTTQGFGGGSYGNGAGGGGGGGGAGANGGDPGPWPSVYAGGGGIGVQLPATFHNPTSLPGSLGGGLGMPGPTATNVSGGTSGKFWVAGGGGGSRTVGSGNPEFRYGRGGYGPDGSGSNFSSDTPIGYAGGGNGAPVDTGTAGSGIQNTGGGGGGGALNSGSGGSGIVLIAYPT